MQKKIMCIVMLFSLCLIIGSTEVSAASYTKLYNKKISEKTTVKSKKTTKKTKKLKKKATKSQTKTSCKRRFLYPSVKYSNGIRTSTYPVEFITKTTKYTKGSRKVKVTTVKTVKNITVKSKYPHGYLKLGTQVGKKLPKKLIKIFNKSDWKVVLDPNLQILKDTKGSSAYKYSGCCAYSVKTIYIQDWEDYTTYPIYGKNYHYTIYHEFGHFFAYYKDGADKTSTWKKIYKKEKVSGYAGTSAVEYFAESFEDYIINKKQLKKERPKTYKYIKRLVDSV